MINQLLIKINNYEIFEAIDKDSLQVQEMIKTNFVKKFPPCFRCNRDKCDCSNNVLIKNQIFLTLSLKISPDNPGNF